jgi:hypothetical protein
MPYYYDEDNQGYVDGEVEESQALVSYHGDSYRQAGHLSDRFLVVLVCLTISLIICGALSWSVWGPLSKLIGSVAGAITALFSGIGTVAPLIGLVVGLAIAAIPLIGVYWLAGHAYMAIKGRSIRNRTFAVDPTVNNYAALYNERTGTFIQPEAGELPETVPSVPQTYSPHIVYQYKDSSTYEGIAGPENGEPQLALPAPPTVLSFGQMLEQNLIVPGQPDILYGWAIYEDEYTGQPKMEQIRGGIELRQTCYILGGMQAGKTSLVVNWSGQEVARGDTLLCGIDPHMNAIDPKTGKPERSLAYRLAPLAQAGYMAWPFAGRDKKDIERVVNALEHEIDARLDNKRTPFSRFNLTFIVDEALALARMANLKNHDPIYDRLFNLMQSVCTETAKVGITGIYMAQLSSKDQMSDIDIRDACPSSVILKTPFQQARNLNLTGEEAKMAHFFEKGHGFFIPASGGDPIHFVYGPTTQEDIAKLAAKLPAPRLLNAGRIHPVRQGERGGQSPYEEESEPESEREPNAERTQVRTQSEPAPEGPLQGKVAEVLAAMGEGVNTKDGIIARVWREKKGSSKGYQDACVEYEQVMRIISSIGRRGMEIYRSAEQEA